MRSVWRRYLIFYFCLGLLAVPIYFVDRALLDPANSSNWIVLDFRGLLFWSYAIWLGIYVVVGSLALWLLPGARKVGAQLGLMVLAFALLLTGFFTYSRALAWKARAQDRVAMEQRKARMNVIELNSWRFVPNEVSPVAVQVDVTVREPGRFAGNLRGERSDATGGASAVLESTNEPQSQRQVSEGERFTYDFPLQIVGPGPADTISITMYLFKAGSGPASGDIAKVFSTSPHPDDDGEYFYAPLPPPKRK